MGCCGPGGGGNGRLAGPFVCGGGGGKVVIAVAGRVIGGGGGTLLPTAAEEETKAGGGGGKDNEPYCVEGRVDALELGLRLGRGGAVELGPMVGSVFTAPAGSWKAAGALDASSCFNAWTPPIEP